MRGSTVNSFRAKDHKAIRECDASPAALVAAAPLLPGARMPMGKTSQTPPIKRRNKTNAVPEVNQPAPGVPRHPAHATAAAIDTAREGQDWLPSRIRQFVRDMAEDPAAAAAGFPSEDHEQAILFDVEVDGQRYRLVQSELKPLRGPPTAAPLSPREREIASMVGGLSKQDHRRRA